MAGLFKNLTKSLITKTVPDMLAHAFPTVAQLERDRKANFESSNEVIGELKSKVSKFKENFAGISNIHRTVLKQVGTGTFGTSVEDQDRLDMKAMGIDVDMFDNLDFGGDSSNEDSGASPGQKNVQINNIHKTSRMPDEITSGDIGIIQSLAKSTAVNAHGGIMQAKILSQIAFNTGLLVAFHSEKTSSYYDLTVDLMKAQLQGQQENAEASKAMFSHYKEEEDRKTRMSHGSRFDPQSILDPTRVVKKVNEHFLLSDMMTGAIGNKIQQGIRDPVGMAAAMAGGALMQKMAGGLVTSLERLARDLPHLAQNKFEKWSAGKDHTKPFSFDSILAGIGDMLKVDTGDSRVRLNRDIAGKAEFDGRTRRAIITEIPGYLAKMLRELESLNGAFHDKYKIKRKDIDHQVYDSDSGVFTRETSIKKDVQKKIKDINEGNQYGGFGNNIESIAMRAGLTPAQTAEVKKLMLHVGRSTSVDGFDPTNHANIMANIKETQSATFQRKQGHSDTQHAAALDAHIKKLTDPNGEISKNMKRFTDASVGDNSAVREAELEKQRVRVSTITDMEEREKAQASYANAIKAYRASKKQGTSEADNLRSSAGRHKLSRFQAAEDFANESESGPSGTVYALNGMSGAMDRNFHVKSTGVKPGMDMNTKLGAISDKLGGHFKQIFESLQAGADKVKDAFNKVFNFIGNWATKGWNAAKNGAMSLYTSVTEGMNRTVFMPMKTWLLGGNDRAAKKFSLIGAMMIGWERKVLQPMKSWLFGGDNKKKSFLTNITEWMGPRINKFLFGAKNSAVSLWDNIKKSMSSVGTFISDKVFAPAKEWFTKSLVPSMKDMFSQIGKEMKHYGGKLKDFFTKDLVKGAKGVLNTLLGDDTIAMLRKNIVDPFKNAVNKLTDSLGGMLKFFMRIPVNFFKGVADSIKIKRMKRGEGTFDDVERTRLEELDKKGSAFDWKNKGSAKPTGLASGLASAPGDMAQVGHDTTDGLNKGLQAGAAAPIKTVETIGEKMITGIKKMLGIHSPSRVMKEVGSNIIAGLVLGIEGAGATVTGAMNKVGERITGSKLSGGTGPSKATGHSDTSVLESIKRSIESINKNTTETDKDVEIYLPQIATNTKNTADALSGMDGKGSSGGKKGGFFGKIGNFLKDLTAAPFKAMKSLFASLKNLPGTIIGAVKDSVKGITDMFGKIIPKVMDGINGLFKSIGPIVENITKALGPVLNSITNVVESMGKSLVGVTESLLKAGTNLVGGIANALKPLTNAVVSVAASLIKSLAPALNTLVGTVGSVINSVAQFGKSIFDLTMSIGQKLLGKMGGMFGVAGVGGGINTATKVDISNWGQMLGASRSRPLFVHVVDGMVAVYKKTKNSVRMTDNAESLSGKHLALKKDEKKEEEKGGLVNDIVGAAKDALLSKGGELLTGTAAGGILARGKGKMGGWIGGLKSKAAGAASTAASNISGAASRATGAAGAAASNAASAASAANKASMMSKLGSSFKNMGSLKAWGGLAKGVGIGSLVSLGGGALTNAFTAEGSKTNKVLNGIFGSVGDAATGAAIGSFIPVIGTTIGAVGGAIYGAVTKLIPAIEDAFKTEIEGFTTAVLEFPDKFTKWIDELPAKVDVFMNDIPNKIIALFAVPTEAEIDPVTGLPKEEKPSILWKLVKALGTAGMTLVAKMPELGLTLAESLGKIIGGALPALGGFLISGTMKFVDTLANMLEDTVLGAKDYLASTWIGGKMGLKVETEESKMQRKIDRNLAQKTRMDAINENTKAAVAGGVDLGGKIGKLTGGVAMGAALLTPVGLAVGAASAGANIATGTGMGTDAKNQNRYEQAMQASGGDEAKAKEYAKKNFGGDVESYWKSGKDLAGTEAGKVRDERYIKWLAKTGNSNDAKGKALFLATEKSEGAISASKAIGTYGSKEVQEALANASSKHGVDLNLLTRMALIESNMDPRAVSATGAKGLLQFVGDTGRAYGMSTDEQLFNPFINADAGARYIKSNINALKSNGIPENELSVYLSHQLGASGFAQVWNAASNGTALSPERLKAMRQNNPGLSSDKIGDARLFISAWDKKIGSNINPFGKMDVAGIKVDSRVSAMASGNIPTMAPSGAMKSRSTYAAMAGVATAWAPTTMASANPPPMATAEVAGNVTSNAAMATYAANESMQEKSMTGTAIQAASAQAPMDSGQIDELRKQTSLLASIVGNTKNIGADISLSFNEAAKVAADDADRADAAQLKSGGSSLSYNRSRTDLFGNRSGGTSGGHLVPSSDARRIASGLSAA